MSNITWVDKDKAVKDGVKNKWRDVDANEVKSAVNSKQDILEAGANISIVGNVISATGGSSGITTISIVSANGLAGTVANPTTTPAITLSTTITGLLKGDGTGISAANAGTDYQEPLISGSGLTFSTNRYDLGGTLTGLVSLQGNQAIHIGDVTPIADFSVTMSGGEFNFNGIGDGLGAGNFNITLTGGGNQASTYLYDASVWGLNDISNNQQVSFGGGVGLQYAADYSSIFTTLSLVDKGYVLSAKAFTGKQTFAQNITTSPINLGGFATDPSVPLEGELSYNLTSHLLKFYNGTSWISADGFTNPMTSVGDLIQGTTAGAPVRLASVAAGGVLLTGGIGVANSWGTVSNGLTATASTLKLGGTITATTTITTGFSFSVTLTGSGNSGIGDNNGTGIGVVRNSLGSYSVINASDLAGSNSANLYFDLTGRGPSTGVYFVDSRSVLSGIEYFADYSSGFTTRSLVDKGYVLGAKTYTGIQTFPSSDIILKNPAATFGYTFVGSAIAANRNLILPLLTANDIIVTEVMTQTLTNKTISGASNTITNVSLTSAVTGILPGANGGTGVANSGKTIALGGNLTTSGAFATTLTTTATTSVTLPVSGTLLSTTNFASGSGTTWNSATKAVDLGGTSNVNTNILISGIDKYFRIGFGKSQVLDGGSLSFPSRGINILSNNYFDINESLFLEGVIIDSSSDATNYSTLGVTNTTVNFGVFSTVAIRSVTLDNQSLRYGADYSATYGTRSLVDKGYADTKWALTGTSTLTGVATITSNAKNQLNFTGTWTATAAADSHMTFGGTFTAASGLGVTGYLFNPTLNAVGTSSVQVGLDVNPTFAGGTTPVNITARFQNGRVVIGNVSASVTGVELLTLKNDQNAATCQIISNATSGTAAEVDYFLHLGGANVVGLKALSAGYSSVGMWVANTGALYSNTSGGLNVGSITAQLSFWTNNTERARFLSTGEFGLGVTVPTAILHLKAGTATANTAPLQFNSGTVETMARAGVMEYDGTNLLFTPSGTTRKTAALHKVSRLTAQTAAVATVATWTVGASDGSFQVSANVFPTTSTTHNFTVTCSYTDESNTARVVTLSFYQLAGTFTTSIINTGGTVPYEGIPLHIRCKAGTTITIGTTGTFTLVTYNVEGDIVQTN